MIDFTGQACVNCRKIEEAVWIDKDVKNILDNEYIIITHREKKTNSLNFSRDINIIEKKTYGRSEIFFFKYF